MRNDLANESSGPFHGPVSHRYKLWAAVTHSRQLRGSMEMDSWEDKPALLRSSVKSKVVLRVERFQGKTACSSPRGDLMSSELGRIPVTWSLARIASS
jgi:hypothetical protein